MKFPSPAHCGRRDQVVLEEREPEGNGAGMKTSKASPKR